MKVYYHDTYTFPLPATHRFPIEKYALVRERLLSQGILTAAELFIPEPASEAQLLLVHTPDYLEKVKKGTLSAAELRRLGFPWSPRLVERSFRSVGSTIEAARAALVEGIAVNLAGGTHHAHANYGEGYCVFNDVAVAARVLQAEGRALHTVVIDCDVHQGDGTAAIFADDPSIFTFSIHGEKNFPFRKQLSDLDIGLPDGAGDEEYLLALQSGLQQSLDRAQAEVSFYLAGADPYYNDRLGRLKLTKAGLAARDRMVLAACKQSGIPIIVTMAGGYSRDINDTVDIHVETVKIFRLGQRDFFAPPA